MGIVNRGVDEEVGSRGAGEQGSRGGR